MLSAVKITIYELYLISCYILLYQSGRSPKVVALFCATNFSSNIIELLQLHYTIQIKYNYA